MALGAARLGILRMLLREALILAGLGVAVGMPCALAANHLLASMLFGLKATNPVVLSAVTALLLVVAMAPVSPRTKLAQSILWWLCDTNERLILQCAAKPYLRCPNPPVFPQSIAGATVLPGSLQPPSPSATFKMTLVL